MVSPYLMRPVRSLQEVLDARQRQRRVQTVQERYRVTALALEATAARPRPAGPKLVWTNAKPPRR